jgi:hypothetical protein
MTFNIGSQQADVINNVQGNQTIHGGQTVTIASSAQALAVVQQLRREIAETAIAAPTKSAARTELGEIERQFEQREPDKPTIGESLARLTKLLASAGALVTGGTTLVTAITGLATWLGGFGARALGLVQGGG